MNALDTVMALVADVKIPKKYSMTIWPVDAPDFHFSEKTIEQVRRDRAAIYYDADRRHFDVETVLDFLDKAMDWADKCIGRFIDGKAYDFFVMGDGCPPMAMYGYHLWPVLACDQQKGGESNV